MKTGIVYHPDYLKHDTGPYHPEKGERLTAILARLEARGLLGDIITPRLAGIEEIALVHTEDYIKQVERHARLGVPLEVDTPVSFYSYHAARLAVGGVITGVEASRERSVFALVRPPGHHALPGRGMGFCLFNNVAVAARHSRLRTLIVDWDVHHGNGTQEAFYHDPDVLYFSIHQYPHYPGTGSIFEIGENEGRGFNVNVPLPGGCGDADYLFVFQEVLVPIARDFRPELVIVSAGQDCHAQDPLGGMRVTDFKSLTAIVKQLAPRIVFALEGGYNPEALASSVTEIIETLNENLEGNLEEKTEVSNLARRQVEEVRRIQEEYWKI